MDDIFKNRLRGGYSNQKAQSSGAVGKAVQSQKTQPFLVWVPTVSVGTHTGFSTHGLPSHAAFVCAPLLHGNQEIVLGAVPKTLRQTSQRLRWVNKV